MYAADLAKGYLQSGEVCSMLFLVVHAAARTPFRIGKRETINASQLI
jgi:hypothetical protein